MVKLLRLMRYSCENGRSARRIDPWPSSRRAVYTPMLICMEACLRRLSQKELGAYYTPDP